MTTAVANKTFAQTTDVDKRGHELATTRDAASAQHEIQSAITIAKHFPRNEDQCFQKLMKSASRASFAEDATYSFPRGETNVTGPSVNLAREAARIWGNIRFGLYVVRDDDDSRLIRGFAWDVENNTKVEVEDDFKKLIQRKVKGSKETTWLIPDERDLRELTNRRGAILLRNAILQVLPKDLIEDALFACSESLTKSAGTDAEAVRKRLLVDFGSVSVTVSQIEEKIGHAFAQCSPSELAELRGICKSIMDGNSTWAEYVKRPEASGPAESPAETQKMDAIRGQLKTGSPASTPTKAEPAATKPTVAPDLKEPTGSTPAPTEGIADELWHEFITYVDDDVPRAKLKEAVKEKMGIGNLKGLRLKDRRAFILSMQDAAKREGITFSIWVKE